MIISNGSIPDKIIYVNYGSQTSYTKKTWTPDGTYHISQNKCDVFEYISDADANALINKLKTRYIKPISTEILDNAPIQNLKLDCLPTPTIRCTIDNKYNVSFSQEELLSNIKDGNIQSGGKIKGEFIWVKVNSSLELTRVGSELHNSIISAVERRNSKKIKKKDLIPFSIYETSAGKKYLFIDFVDTTALYVSRSKYNPSQTSNSLDFFSSKKSKQIFSIAISGDGQLIYENINDKNFDQLKYRFQIFQGHSFVRRVSSVDLSSSLIEEIREYFRNSLKKDIIESSQGNHYSGYLPNQIVWNSKLFNIRKHKESVPDFDFKKYLAFV